MHIQHRIFKICNKQLISFAEELQMLLNTHLWKQFSTLLANTLNMDPFVVSQLFPCLLHYSTIIANQRVSRMQHLHVSVKIGLRHERFIADVAYNSLQMDIWPSSEVLVNYTHTCRGILILYETTCDYSIRPCFFWTDIWTLPCPCW